MALGRGEGKTRVLVVDDEETAVRATVRALRPFDYECEGCSSAETALEPETTAGFDVIILDLTMPGYDGIMVARQLRLRGYEGVIIMVSASTGDDEKERALIAGVDDYLVKPVAGTLLYAHIRVRLASHAKQCELVELAAVPLSTPRGPEAAPESGRDEVVNRPIHFLVADGNAARRAYMSRELAKLGAIVTDSASERAALAAMEKPGLDGVMLWSKGDDSRALELCSELRARAPNAAILLVCCNLGTPSAAVAAAGADLAFPEHTPLSAMWFAAGSCVHQRRTTAGVVDLGHVQIHLNGPFVVVDGQESRMGPVEHKLAVALARRYPGGRLSSRQLRSIMGYLIALVGRDAQTGCVQTGAEAFDAIRSMEAEACWIGTLRPTPPFADASGLCRDLREHFPDLAILATGNASDDLDTACACIAAGADACYPRKADISTIWFGTAALVANRRARRTVCDLGRVRVFLNKPYVEIDGQLVDLTPKEHAILKALAKAYPRALSTVYLHQECSGYASEPTLDSNPVAQMVKRLRKKLRPYGHWLVSSRAGYALRAPRSSQRLGEPTATE